MISKFSLIRLCRRNRLPLTVFIVSSLLTVGSWQYALHLDELQAGHRFDNIAQDYQQDLSDRFNTYLRALVDLRGLFDSSRYISRTEFDAFMQSTNLIEDFPGITRIGYSPLVQTSEIAAFEARAKGEGFANFRLKSIRKEESFFPVLYAYPLTNRIKTDIVGLDLAELPNRRDAMILARDTNRPVVTRKISLPSDLHHNPAIGIYLPVYRHGASHNTLAERRRALAGFVFEGFTMEDLLRGAFGQSFINNIDLKIYDGLQQTPAALLYQTHGAGGATTHSDILRAKHTATIRVANNDWSVVFTSKPGFYQANRTQTPTVVLFSGLLTTLLLTGIAAQISSRRRLAWAKEEQNQHFHSLFDQNPYAVFSLDLLGCFTSVNDASVKLAGLNKDELLGMHFGQLVAQNSVNDALFLFTEAKKGIPQQGEVTITHPSGKLVHLNVTSLPIVVQGRIIGVFGIAKDITEQVLAESENRRMQHLLDTIIDNIPVMLFVKEAKDLRFVVWNKAGEKLTGFPREEVLKKTDCDLFSKESADYFRETDRRVLKSGNFLDIAEEAIQTSKGTRLLHTKKVPFSMEGAQYLLGVSEDITEKKRAQEALHESEARFRAIFEQAPVGINQVDLNNVPLRVNQKLLDIVGYSFEELKTKTLLHDLTHPDDLDYSQEYDRKIKAGELDRYSIEKRYIRKDGSIVWVHLTKTTIQDTDGKPVFLIALVEDITERRQAEAQIRKQQQLLSTIVDTLPLNLFIRDREERFVLINKYAASTVGRPKEEVIGKRLADVFPHQVVESFRAHDVIVWNSQKTLLIEERIHQLGDEKYVLAGKLPLYLEGESPLLLGYSIDITERKRAEDALQRAHDELEDKVRERTEELNNAYQTLRKLSSHMQVAREDERTRIAREVHDEMGGVLTAIKIDISMLKQRQEANDQVATPELDRTLQLVDTAVTSLRRIITDLRPSILDTLGLQAALEWQLQEFEKRTKVRCSFQMKGDEYELDDGRATAVFRIFQEALTNVAKHAQATRLDVFGKVTEDEIIIKIKDNGVGITKERCLNSGAFGILGMQERARIFNGSVRVAGEPSKGTSVLIKFPLICKHR